MSDWMTRVNAIYDKHPLMYDRRGIEAPEGWLDIIARMSDELSAIPDVPTIVQVKEKFGTLRVYFTRQKTDEVRAVVEAAEKACYCTCDICGQAGSLAVIRGVYKVVCPVHEDEIHILQD